MSLTWLAQNPVAQNYLLIAISNIACKNVQCDKDVHTLISCKRILVPFRQLRASIFSFCRQWPSPPFKIGTQIGIDCLTVTSGPHIQLVIVVGDVRQGVVLLYQRGVRVPVEGLCQHAKSVKCKPFFPVFPRFSIEDPFVNGSQFGGRLCIDVLPLHSKELKNQYYILPIPFGKIYRFTDSEKAFLPTIQYVTTVKNFKG